jgi:hypothetical protein
MSRAEFLFKVKMLEGELTLINQAIKAIILDELYQRSNIHSQKLLPLLVYQRHLLANELGVDPDTHQTLRKVG